MLKVEPNKVAEISFVLLFAPYNKYINIKLRYRERAARATIACSLSRDEKRRARMREPVNNGLS